MNRILEGGNDINLLFSSPGFTPQVLLDWLHTMDLEATADFSVKGPVYIEGSTQEQRVRNLFVTMQAYNKEGQPSSRLQNLTLLIRKSTSSSPTLRAKAALARRPEPPRDEAPSTTTKVRKSPARKQSSTARAEAPSE